MANIFNSLKLWLFGTEPEARRLAEKHIATGGVGLATEHTGDRQDDGQGMISGGVIWPVDAGTHGARAFLTSWCFLAYYDAADQLVYMLDDLDGRFHPGATPLIVDDNVKIASGKGRSGKGYVTRTAEFGEDGLYKNVFKHWRTDLIAHHLQPDPPENSSLVADPDEEGREAGIQWQWRVRKWVRKLCSAGTTPKGKPGKGPEETTTGADEGVTEEVFALMLNGGTNGDGTPGYLLTHFDRGEAVLSDEAKGFAGPADDDNHLVAVVQDIEVLPAPPIGIGPAVPIINIKEIKGHQGGLNIVEALWGSTKDGIIYSPAEFINAQWIPGGKGPMVKRVEWREDLGDRHTNYCGRKIPGRKKWMTWADIGVYETDPSARKTDSTPAGEKGDATPSGEKGDPGPKTGDPPGTPRDPTPASEKGSKPPPGGGPPPPGGGGPPPPANGDPTPKGAQPSGPNDGPITGDPPGSKGPQDGSPNSASSPGQLESPSTLGHPQPGLPDGIDYNRAGTTGHEQFWLSRFGVTEQESVEAPQTADQVAFGEFLSATPNEGATGPARWEPRVSQESIYTMDDQKRVTSRAQAAKGPGGFADMGAGLAPELLYYENRSKIPATSNTFTRLILGVKNAAGSVIRSILHFGSRLITGENVAGWSAELDFSSSATEPDLNWTKRNASGANAGGGRFMVNGVEVGTGSGDVVGPASAVSGNLANFSGTSGKSIADSGIATLDLATLSGNLSGIGDKSTALTNLGILRGIVADDLTFASTTMAAVTGMSVTVEASSLYQFEADILISGATLDVEDPDNSRTGAKFDFGGGTATITSTNYGYTLISNTTGTFVMEVTAMTTDISDAADGTKRRYRIQGHVHSNTAGTIIMQAAANTGTTTPTSEATVHKGTWMRLTKVG